MLIDHLLFGEPFSSTAQNIIEVIRQSMEVSTLFVTVNDPVTNTVVKVHNPQGGRASEGRGELVEETFCNLVCASGRLMVIIPDTGKDPITSSLEFSKPMGHSSFMGIPLRLEDGAPFGTICAIHSSPYAFNKREIALFQSMASLLENVVRLEYSMFKDELTGVCSPYFVRTFYRNCDMKINPLGVLYFGLDDFKSINDQLGREYGDRLLIHCSRTIEHLAGEEAVVVRMEGDHFAVVVREPTLSDLMNRAQAIRAAVRKIKLPVEGVTLTTSIGIAMSESNMSNIKELLRQARERMLQVKQYSKNGLSYN